MASANDGSVDTEEDVLTTEILVLESIYITELSVEQDEKGRARSIDVVLHPATGMDESKQYVCMTLGFSFPPNYPHEVPEITVKNPRGLGDENLRSLIEDMKKTAEERKGGEMLYELIEMAKDCLTEGNLPHCECAICLDNFEEGDNFIKTDCYHYFHRACLARCAAAFMVSVNQEEASAVLHVNKNEEENVFRCPMCRVPLTCDLSDLLTETPPEEKEVDFVLSPELVRQQQERAALYHQQKAKGGIIDLEVEKNKFFVDENTVVSLNRRPDDEIDRPPDLNSTPQEEEQPRDSKKDYSHKKVEDGKRGENRRAATQGFIGSRKCYMDDFADLNQGYSDYDDDYVNVAENRGSGRGRRRDHQSSRPRGQGRRLRGSRPSAGVSLNSKSWKTDGDFISSGQGYSEDDQKFANGGVDIENDRHGGRGPKMDHQASRRDGRGNNRTYHRDRQEDFRDYRDGKNYRRDQRSNKENSRGSGHIRRRKEDIWERKEDSGNRWQDDRNRKESSRLKEEGLQDDRTDSLENLRDFRKEDKERTCDTDRNDFENGRTSPRDQPKDQQLPRKEQGRGWYHRDNRRDGQEAGQGPSSDRDRLGENRERPGQQRTRENRDTRPRGYHKEREDRDSPREIQAGENKDTRPKGSQKTREDRINNRDSPRETQADGHRDTRPRGPQKNTEDRANDRHSPRDLPKETQAETGRKSQHSPRENEGHSRPQSSRNHWREFRDDRRHDQWSNDYRHSTHHRKQENDHGSWRENTQQINDKDSRVDGDVNNHETVQEGLKHGLNRRSDRTFVRGQGNRGRFNRRGQNRPVPSQSEMDTAPQYQRSDRQVKTQGEDCKDQKGGRPEQFYENGKEDWDSECVEQKKLSLNSKYRDKPRETTKKENTRTEVCHSSKKDWETETDPYKPPTSKHQQSVDQRSSKPGKGHSAHDRPQDYPKEGDSMPGQGGPPGFASRGPPPGFGERDSSRKSPPADVPKPVAKVGPPPGFS